MAPLKHCHLWVLNSSTGFQDIQKPQPHQYGLMHFQTAG